MCTAVLAVAGCGTSAPPPVAGPSAAPLVSATSSASPLPRPSGVRPSGPRPSRQPAAAAGGACQLLDYGIVEQTVGLSFEVAGGGQQDATYTCVLQRTGVTVPDLSLAVTPTSADPVVFRSTVAPKGAPVLTGLGKVAYQLALPPVPKTGRGPGVEIGWLSANNRILVLRCTLAPDSPAPADLAAKLVELAKKVDQTTV